MKHGRLAGVWIGVLLALAGPARAETRILLDSERGDFMGDGAARGIDDPDGVLPEVGDLEDCRLA